MPALPLVSISRGLCRAGPRGLGDLVPDGLKTAGAAGTKIGADHKGFISVYPFDEFEAAGAHCKRRGRIDVSLEDIRPYHCDADELTCWKSCMWIDHVEPLLVRS